MRHVLGTVDLVQYEGFHTKIAVERAAMRRVFWHLLVAILVIPSLTLIALEVFIEYRLGGLEQLWESGGLFSDGVVAIKFMVQAALLGNVADLLRIPGQLAQRWKKRSALTRREFEQAEKVGLFPYFYEWPYMLGLFTLVLSFSVRLVVLCAEALCRQAQPGVHPSEADADPPPRPSARRDCVPDGHCVHTAGVAVLLLCR
jgi:hypothetical protein